MQTLGTLSPIQPYDFGLTLGLISRFPHPTVDVVHDDAYWRVVQVNGQLILLRITALASDKLVVHAMTDTGHVDHQAILDRAAHILCTDVDLSGFYAYAKTQPELWQVIEPTYGLRWLRTETVYEALMTTIIEQQIAWKTAQKAQRWLVEWGGNRIRYQGRNYYAFPTPEQIALATVDDITPLKITFRRMAVMIDISKQIVANELDLEGILHLLSDEAYQRLIQLKGIGHWTAAWTIQRAYGVNQFVGHNDVALQAAVNHYFYGGTGRIPANQVTNTFAAYGQYTGLAAHHTILRWVMDRY